MPSLALPSDRPACRDILEEHLEERAFLWLQRRKLLFSSEVPLRRLPGHDDRIAAHDDGLVIGGSASVEIAVRLLEDEDDPWRFASELQAWLTIGRPESATALARLESAAAEMVPSQREALRWCDMDTVLRVFPPTRAASLPAPMLALAIEALAWRQALPPPVASHAAQHADPGVRASLARVLAWPGTSELAMQALDRLVDDADPSVRRRARFSAALRDAEGLRDRLRRARPGQLDAFDLQLIGLLGDDEDAVRLAREGEDDARLAPALLALGELGTESAIATLLRVLEVPSPPAQLAATAGLERALGPLAGEEGDEPSAASLEAARTRFEVLHETLPRGARLCRGRALPWDGEPRDEPMLWRWRSALTAPTRETRPLTMHVPDGFWEVAPTFVARPGE